MKKTALALLLLSALLLSLTACGASSGRMEATDSSAVYDMPAEAVPEEDVGLYYTSSTALNTDSPTLPENTKLIHTAELDFQTVEFDQSIQGLEQLVSAHKGYYESSEFSSGSYYSSNTSRSAYFVIRVPKEEYQAFLSSVGTIGHEVSRYTDTQDVGEVYYNTELRLATLQTKHTRLLALLEQATVMEDIIALESSLSDVEYEIQQLTSTLNRYDGLIDYTTIRLNLQEVTRVSQEASESDPLSVRLGAAFSEGWQNFCEGLGNFTVWIAYHFVGILLFLGIIAAFVLALKKLLSPRKKDHTIPPPNNDTAK